MSTHAIITRIRISETEWWYFTGNLNDESGRRLGYELTFFRQGIRPLSERNAAASRFIVNDLKFAHFTVTDAAGKMFLFHQKASRGSFGEAGFDAGDRVAWIDSWNLRMNVDGSFDLAADATDAQVQLHLLPLKRPVVHGASGISQKAEGGHASHYYSITRLQTTGTVRVKRITASSPVRVGSITNGRPTNSRRGRPDGTGSRRSSRTKPS